MKKERLRDAERDRKDGGGDGAADVDVGLSDDEPPDASPAYDSSNDSEGEGGVIPPRGEALRGMPGLILAHAPAADDYG